MKSNFSTSSADTPLISAQIYQELKTLILNGKLNVKDYLTEVSVANLFNVSRTPAHEALRKLEAEHIIVSIPRKGYEIRCNIAEQELTDLYNVAIAVSSSAAYYAAINRTKEQIQYLRGLLSNAVTYSPDHDDAAVTREIIMANYSFHTGIGVASGNQYLAKYVNDVHEKTMLHSIYQINFQSLLSEADNDIPLYSHDNILKAIELQEAELARFLMEQHLTYSRNHLKKHPFIQA